jgi:hypothetical protein
MLIPEYVDDIPFPIKFSTKIIIIGKTNKTVTAIFLKRILTTLTTFPHIESLM